MRLWNASAPTAERVPAGWSSPWREVRALIAFRAALVTLALLLTAISGNLPRLAVPCMLLVAIALLPSLPRRVPAESTVVLVLEAALAIAVATWVSPAAGPLMVYWMAPALGAGIRGGYRGAVAAVALPGALGALLVLRSAGPFVADSLLLLLQWGALALALGMLGSWARMQQLRAVADPQRSYADAVRVLTELESIAHRLPVGLDVGGIGLRLLREVAGAVPAERSVVLARTGTEDYVVVAGLPDAAPDWVPEISEAMVGGPPTVHEIAGHAGERITVLPLVVGSRRVGLVLLLAPEQLGVEERSKLEEIAAMGALPMEAALLFDAVRDVAVSEERDRVAREIHDGIAQDIASLGYAVDEIRSTAPDESTRERAAAVRREITRVVSELRLSVFNLRAAAPTTATLGATLSDHAQRTFQQAQIRIHINLDEASQRLRPTVEGELMRIAQEALTNARRHSGATNVWLECSVRPPHARITVADDGSGLGPRRLDSFGIDIMHERARRVGAELRIDAREGGGTVVCVEV